MNIKEAKLHSITRIITQKHKDHWLSIVAYLIITQAVLFAQSIMLLRPNNSKDKPTSNTIIMQNEKNLENLRTGEFLLDTDVFYVPAPYGQWPHSVAFDGTNYLVVWTDSRSGYSSDIYGARVTTGGVVLYPAGIVISNAVNDQFSPSVAFDGTCFLIAWIDYRSVSSSDIYGARVTQTGVVLDTNGIAISTEANTQFHPAIAFDGSNYVVAWHDTRNGSSDIYGARVTTGGVVLDPTGFAISIVTSEQYDPSIAFDGTNYLVVWKDSRGSSYDIYGTRITPAGMVLDSGDIAITIAALTQQSPSLAFDGAYYLVAWSDYRNDFASDVYAARVTPTGAVLDSNGIAISTEVNYQGSPSIAFDGINFLVVWQDARIDPSDIYGARVTSDGLVLDSAGIAISTAVEWQRSPAIAFDGTNYLAIWTDCRSGSTDNYGTRMTSGGVVLDPNGITISTAANTQLDPSIALDSTSYLVVWTDDRCGTCSDIYGARVSSGHAILDTIALAISTAAGWQQFPSVAFDGTNYLAVWTDGRSSPGDDIYGARITSGGMVLDPDGIAISMAMYTQSFPSIAYDGTNYLVVWRDERNGSFSDIYGARVTTGGVVLDPNGIAISTAIDNQDNISVAFDGTNYLVVWKDERNGSYSDIYGARVTTGGAVLDSNGIAISTAAYYEYFPSVAFDGSNYLVAWDDTRNGSSDIYGARVTTGGVVLDPTGFAISIVTSEQYDPSIAFDGTNYWVVWTDDRNDYHADIYGAITTPSGTVMDSFAVSTQPGDQLSPYITAGSGGQLLIAYSGFTDSINNHPANTMRIWGKFYPFISIEENAGFVAHDAEFRLEIYPNPFLNNTMIKIHPHPNPPPLTGRKSDAQITLKIYDTSGRLVKSFNHLTDQQLQVIWYGDDDSRHTLPAGVYFCRLEAKSYRMLEKIIKIR